MNIEIKDPLEMLTKTQKYKIRKMFVEKKTKKEILDNIHYHNEGETETEKALFERYNDFDIIEINSNHFWLEFAVLEEDSKTKMKNKLRDKMQELKNSHRKEWQMYRKLKDMVSGVDKNDEFPNPERVRAQKDVYGKMIGENKKNPITQYLELCLQDI